jgi:hypothetical protein
VNDVEYKPMTQLLIHVDGPEKIFSKLQVEVLDKRGQRGWFLFV